MHFVMVVAVILELPSLLKVFYSLFGLLREPIAEERIFGSASTSPIFLT